MRHGGFHTYYVYIITNRNKTVLYTGITNNMARRLFEHKENIRLHRKSFAARYNCRHLVYYETLTWVQDAIAREKEIKGWRREKKILLIRALNSNMNFLEHLFPYEANKAQ